LTLETELWFKTSSYDHGVSHNRVAIRYVESFLERPREQEDNA
jgi:hypothetical protein